LGIDPNGIFARVLTALREPPRRDIIDTSPEAARTNYNICLVEGSPGLNFR
jgi:hypothetical protein